MFSYRVPRPPDATRLEKIVERFGDEGRDYIDLTAANPTQVGLTYPRDRLASIVGQPGIALYEPTSNGLHSARAAVATEYERLAVAVDPARIVLTSSSAESYGMLFRLLCNAGESVLVPQPSYPAFAELGQMESIKIIPYPVRYSRGWYIDPEELLRVCEPSTRALIVVNPNNPTGSYVKREELDRLVQLCAYNKLALISDENFAEYPHREDVTRVPSVLGTHAIVHFALSGLSRLACLPQCKLAWVAYGGPPRDLKQLDWRMEMMGRTYRSVSTVTQQALPELLRVGGELRGLLLSRIRTNLGVLQSALRSSIIEPLAVEGGWFVTLRLPRTRPGEDWAIVLMERDSVLTQPGQFFDFEEDHNVVLSLIAPEAKFATAVDRIVARVAAE